MGIPHSLLDFVTLIPWRVFVRISIWVCCMFSHASLISSSVRHSLTNELDSTQLLHCLCTPFLRSQTLSCPWYSANALLFCRIFPLKIFKYLTPFYLSGFTGDTSLWRESLLHFFTQYLSPPSLFTYTTFIIHFRSQTLGLMVIQLVMRHVIL